MSSYHSSVELPAPTEEQVAHSERLIECIKGHIVQAGGSIPFSDYMHHCLYEPGLGYYAAGSIKLGQAGDFITAPEISPLFGQSLAHQAVALFEQGLQPDVLEFGAGSGKLCRDLLLHFQSLDVEWSRYLILEPSPDLQQRQQSFLQQHLSAEAMGKIHWLSSLPECFNGLVLGNEVLDAMPVHVVLKQDRWLELGVGFTQDRFQWVEYADDTDVISQIEAIDRSQQLAQHYCTEINDFYGPWCKALFDRCDQAVVLMIDYGYEQAQYYHPTRTSGTLMCFYQHRSHPDPFIYPGLQDITAFVDFDAFADAALAAGFSLVGLTTQANFLMKNGLLDLIENPDSDAISQLSLAQQVKTLTLPGEMGEKFKVIGLQKNLDLSIIGLRD